MFEGGSESLQFTNNILALIEGARKIKRFQKVKPSLRITNDVRNGEHASRTRLVFNLVDNGPSSIKNQPLQFGCCRHLLPPRETILAANFLIQFLKDR